MSAKKKAPAYAAPKFPRIVVSPARHKALGAEATKKGITLTELAEAKFKAAK